MKWLIALMSLIFLISCAGRTYLKTESLLDPPSITGQYRVLLVGQSHIDDFKTVAILDLEGDKYEIIPQLPDYSYTVFQNLEGSEATAVATQFLRKQGIYRHERIEIIRVYTHDNITIGYEMRPHYKPFVFGALDLIDVRYRLNSDNTVRMFIDVKIIEVQ